MHFQEILAQLSGKIGAKVYRTQQIELRDEEEFKKRIRIFKKYK